MCTLTVIYTETILFSWNYHLRYNICASYRNPGRKKEKKRVGRIRHTIITFLAVVKEMLQEDMIERK